MKRWILIVMLIFCSALPCEAGDSKQPQAKRQKVIDFEGDVVEGVNKRPLDSLSQISQRNKHRKPHLYRKRRSFRTESLETLREMRTYE